MDLVPTGLVSFLSTQGFVIFVPGKKVEDQSQPRRRLIMVGQLAWQPIYILREGSQEQKKIILQMLKGVYNHENGTAKKFGAGVLSWNILNKKPQINADKRRFVIAYLHLRLYAVFLDSNTKDFTPPRNDNFNKLIN